MNAMWEGRHSSASTVMRRGNGWMRRPVVGSVASKCYCRCIDNVIDGCRLALAKQSALFSSIGPLYINRSCDGMMSMVRARGAVAFCPRLVVSSGMGGVAGGVGLREGSSAQRGLP